MTAETDSDEGPLRQRSLFSRAVGWLLVVLFVAPVPVALIGVAIYYLAT